MSRHLMAKMRNQRTSSFDLMAKMKRISGSLLDWQQKYHEPDLAWHVKTETGHVLTINSPPRPFWRQQDNRRGQAGQGHRVGLAHP